MSDPMDTLTSRSLVPSMNSDALFPLTAAVSALAGLTDASIGNGLLVHNYQYI